MIKLSNMQRLVLSSACLNEDGLAPRPAGSKPAQAAKLLATLIENALVREVRAKAGMPGWREDEQGRAVAVKILKAGRQALAAFEQACGARTAEPSPPADAASSKSAHPDRVSQAPSLAAARGSKRALIIGLMQREQGATIDDLVAATDWLPHTTRAALSGLRKGGLAIERSKSARGSASVYRIAGDIMSAAA